MVFLLTGSVRVKRLQVINLATLLQFILPADTPGHGPSGLNYRGGGMCAQNHSVSQLEEPLSSLNI